MLYRRLSSVRNPTTKSLTSTHVVLRTTVGSVNLNAILPTFFLRNPSARLTNLRLEVQAGGGGGGGNGENGGLCYGAPGPQATGGFGSEGKAGTFFRVTVSRSVFQDTTANINLGGGSTGSGVEQSGDGAFGRNPNKGGSGGRAGRTGVNTVINLGVGTTVINVVGGAGGGGGGGGGQRRGNSANNTATSGGNAGNSTPIYTNGGNVFNCRGGNGGASGGTFGCYYPSQGGGFPGFTAPSAKPTVPVPAIGTLLLPQSSITQPNHGISIFNTNSFGRGGTVGVDGGVSAILITGTSIRI